jgi:RNA polymerase sigma-70 factor, ECF subfamily
MSERPNSELFVVTSLDAPAQTQTFDSLFRRYAPYVGAIALRILGRESEVDDLVQDVFIDAYRGIRELKDPGAIRGWLSRITVRRAVRMLKRRKFRALFMASQPPDYEQVADSRATPEQAAALAGCYRALDRLPTEERVAFTLRYLAGEELEQVAVLTGASLATVKRRIARAQDALKGMNRG